MMIYRKKYMDQLLSFVEYVVRMDDLAGGNYEGIKTMHLADFLLSHEF